MALKDAGLNIVWIDKATFPRDKVCGDAIPSNVQRVLKSIDGLLNEKFLQHFTEKVQVEGCRFIAPDKTSFDLSFVTKGHAAKRLHFDDFLFNMANECNSHVSFIGNASVESIINSATAVTVRSCWVTCRSCGSIRRRDGMGTITRSTRPSAPWPSAAR